MSLFCDVIYLLLFLDVFQGRNTGGIWRYYHYVICTVHALMDSCHNIHCRCQIGTVGVHNGTVKGKTVFDILSLSMSLPVSHTPHNEEMNVLFF